MSKSFDLPFVPSELAASARDAFQPRYATPLTQEDGREIASNLLGVFRILREWQAKHAANGGVFPTRTPPARPYTPKRRRTPATE
jgi:hypothetical protein